MPCSAFLSALRTPYGASIARQSTISRPTYSRTHGTSIGSADDGKSHGINVNLNGSLPEKRAFNVPSQSAPSLKDSLGYGVNWVLVFSDNQTQKVTPVADSRDYGPMHITVGPYPWYRRLERSQSSAKNGCSILVQ
eukprot:scaffold99754_cov58-Attheya_sp.AAC.3